MTPPDLAAAVRRSLETRDPAPFDAAAAALWPVIARAGARGALGDVHLGEDAAQDAILVARAHLGDLADHGKALGWICGIASRRGKDLRRAEGTRARLETVAARPEGFAHPSAPNAPLSSPVASALSRLTSAERGAAELVLLGGGTIRAYSVAAGISLGAAKVRTTRARAHLRRLLAPSV